MLEKNLDINSARASAAHLLGYVFLKQFPKALCVGGGVTSIGFFYEFVTSSPIDSNILNLLETEIKNKIKENLEIKTLSIMRENASALFNHHKQHVLADIVLQEEYNVVDICQIDSFYDLSLGKEAPSTNQIGAVKLLEFKMIDQDLLRIEGTTFPNPQQLKDFLKAYEKYKKFNADELGTQLKLFFKVNEEIYWLPKGEWIRNQLKEICQLYSDNLQMISTPLNTREQHTEVFNHHNRLPSRFGQISHGKDLSTFFCTTNQVIEELIYSLQIFQEIVKMFGFKANWYLSYPEKGPFVIALEREFKELNFPVNEEKGPLGLEVKWVDSLGREWDGPFCSGWMVNNNVLGLARTLFPSFDQMVRLILERFRGDLPLWIAPEQIRVLQVGNKNGEYTKKVFEKCLVSGFRATLDDRDTKLGDKVHEVESEKIPFVLIVGDKEAQAGKVTVRVEGKSERNLVDLNDFLGEVKKKLLEEFNRTLES